MSMGKTTRFEAADYLDSAEACSEYMTAALETGELTQGFVVSWR